MVNERLEQNLAEREKIQAEIVQETQEETDRLRTQLAQLRAEYEDIEMFLRIVVPDQFVDEWMRERPRNNNEDEDSEG